MIAHRLNTLKNCDLILTLENGQLTQVKHCEAKHLSFSAS